MNDVMVDLETLGNGSNSVIISIGAVRFNKAGLSDEFYMSVAAQSCVDIGLTMDASTVLWWMGQSDKARQNVLAGTNDITTVLKEFGLWIGSDAKVWGNGATFDNVILVNAYRLAKIPRPWKYTNDRCYRTLKSLYPQIKRDENKDLVAHDALDDAKGQALHAVKIFNHIGG